MTLPPLYNPPGLPLAGRRVVCFGIGASGVASGLFLNSHGVDALVVDEQPAGKLQGRLAELERAGVRALPGLTSYEQLGDPDLIIISPGVPTNHPMLEQARAAGAQVIGEIELAYRFSPAPIAAITGTNGKGTTTKMLEGMLQAGGLRAQAGGNIGRALIGLVEEPLDVLVAEVSSFQLETIELFHPWASILLNITPDHLNRYADMDEYVAAKERLFLNQDEGDVRVLNMDDPRTAQVAGRLAAPYLSVSLRDPEANGTLRGDDLTVRLPGEAPVRVGGVDEMFVKGDHYVIDALCAAIVARSAGVAPDRIAQAVADWRPVDHQLQEVAVVGGVRFVDDSKATNPEAALADIAGVGRPVLVIAGGLSKDLDMRTLAEGLVRGADGVFLIGESAGEIAAGIAGRIPVTVSGDLDAAVPAAFAAAGPGTTIILAPGCASFDQYSGQAARGEHFAALVRQLQEHAQETS